jgi:RNA-directed DNA polymerase
MRRSRGLFERILDRSNFRRAVARAARGKRHRPVTRRLLADLEERCGEIADQLRNASYPFGKCAQFLIHDPKERLITAPAFEERVIHHAVIQVCEPRFESWLIDDTFACRTGRGRLAAIDRARLFSGRHSHFLKLDIRKYFDSVSHPILRRLLRRLFADRPLLDLFDQIIGAYRGLERRGLPIGSLTSQHFANFYLGWFDRQVKEVWRVPGYVRYMDDMVLWSDSAAELRFLLRELTTWLETTLELQLKPRPYINRVGHGIDFLSARVYPTYHTVSRKARVRIGRRWRYLQRQWEAGTIAEAEFQRRATSLFAFLTAGGADTKTFRERLLRRSNGIVVKLEEGGRSPCEEEF